MPTKLLFQAWRLQSVFMVLIYPQWNDYSAQGSEIRILHEADHRSLNDTLIEPINVVGEGLENS